jgi:hypothetical protein
MKPVKITFTDHFLNTFEGTQEELDAIVEELKQKFAAGNFEEFFEDPNELITIGTGHENFSNQQPRVLH